MVIGRILSAICPLLVAAGCTGGAHTSIEDPAQPSQRRPALSTAADEPARCDATRVVPCQCKRGKGYRKCESGQLGACICQPLGRAKEPAIRGEEPRDPLAAPSNVRSPPSYARTTRSGLSYVVLRRGRGRIHPTARTRVTVHYTGWTTDGKMFDSSVKRGRPASFQLNRLIAGWTEGLQLMVEGDKFRFWIPASLAYKNRPGRPMGMLVFDVQMIRVY